ncbi:recombinase family protein [Rossellomorea aquimaris]|nr:recombinase family protein [Rossellomorea aquimaris]WRP06582.1 recombinase family protein [Rossellomorea aquimaris]
MNNEVESVLYIRSANNAKESLELQRLMGGKYANDNSMSLRIIADTHASGKSGNTPVRELAGLRNLLYLIEIGIIKTVLVGCLTRISRDVKEVLYFQALLRNHNAKLIVLSDEQ